MEEEEKKMMAMMEEEEEEEEEIYLHRLVSLYLQFLISPLCVYCKNNKSSEVILKVKMIMIELYHYLATDM